MAALLGGDLSILRQFEDEKQIIQDTCDVVQRLVVKAKLVAGMSTDGED